MKTECKRLRLNYVLILHGHRGFCSQNHGSINFCLSNVVESHETISKMLILYLTRDLCASHDLWVTARQLIRVAMNISRLLAE